MPLDEVKAGMTGTGHTVFQGTELQEFKVHILGVLRNVQGPRRSLILAKLEGGPLADTGVIAGMSGSPVYVDGRLIGAVSYSIGQFAKEPIAGITPIAEMIEATAETSRRAPAAQARVDLPVTAETFAAAIRQTSARIGSFAEGAVDIGSVGVPSSTGGPMAGTLRPIATPLIMSGVTAATRDLVSTIFSGTGLAPVLAGSSGGADTPKPSGPLRPGDAVGVSLLGGDAEMGATGTVTHVDGSRVYAFGHPFFNFGPTAFPMTRAYIYTSLPSLMSSFKIASLGDVIGTVQQDRATAIAGTLGAGPRVIPINLTLESDRGPRRTFHYSVVDDQLFTPLLTYVALFNTLGSYERQFGAVTFTVKGKTAFAEHTDLNYEDIFTGDNPIAGASAYVAGPLTMLLAQRPRAGHGEEHRSHRLALGRAAQRDDRAGVARRRAAAGRADGAAEGADAQLSRHRKDLDDSDRHPGERVGTALGDGHRRPTAQSARAARAPSHAAAAERGADDSRAQRNAP